jgi:hypothetical protein
MTRIPAAFAALFVVVSSPLGAQTDAQVAAEPIIRLQPGETRVEGQCLSRQEFDLIDALNALRRPTVGVEGDGDDFAPFDPQYFVGTWRVEGVLPESPLGEGGPFIGTETVRHVEGCTYEGILEATLSDETITISSRLIYDRRESYLVRIEDDSRGFQLLKVGPQRGDPGGFTSHHWEAPAINYGGSEIIMSGRAFITSPYNYNLRMRMSSDGGPLEPFGTLQWERLD